MKLNPIGSNQNEVVLNPLLAVLFSYSTPVSAQVNGKYYRTNKFWSKTTSKHINKWLNNEEAEEKNQEFFDNLVK